MHKYWGASFLWFCEVVGKNVSRKQKAIKFANLFLWAEGDRRERKEHNDIETMLKRSAVLFRRQSFYPSKISFLNYSIASRLCIQCIAKSMTRSLTTGPLSSTEEVEKEGISKKVVDDSYLDVPGVKTPGLW